MSRVAYTGRDVSCPVCKARTGRRCLSRKGPTAGQHRVVYHPQRLAKARVRWEKTIPTTEECPAPQHDATGYQRYGCRCDLGRAAQRRYFKARRLAKVTGAPSTKVPAVLAVRRIRALMRIGYTLGHLAALTGVERCTFHTATTRDRVSRKTYDAICRVYDQISEVPGPSQRAVADGERKGWPGPWCWTPETIDDPDAEPQWADYDPEVVDVDVLVERIRTGHVSSTTLTRTDRKRVAERMLTDGKSSFTATERLLHMNHRRALQIAEAS